jgi:hypothetical protein
MAAFLLIDGFSLLFLHLNCEPRVLVFFEPRAFWFGIIFIWLVYLDPQSYLTTINVHYTIFKVLIIYSKAQLYGKRNDIPTKIINKLLSY